MFGAIKHFISWRTEMLATIKPFKTNGQVADNVGLPENQALVMFQQHKALQCIEETNELSIIPVCNIMCKCILTEVYCKNAKS